MSSLLDASSKILELFRIRYRYIEPIENMDMSSLDSCVYWSSFFQRSKETRKERSNWNDFPEWLYRYLQTS